MSRFTLRTSALVAVFLLSVAPLAMASSEAPAAMLDLSCAEANLSPASEPLFLGAGKKAPTSSLMTFQGLENGRVACVWYDISCSNGTTDECCGSSSSCGAYCAEVCGEPCIEVNE